MDFTLDANLLYFINNPLFLHCPKSSNYPASAFWALCWILCVIYLLCLSIDL